MKTLNIMIGLFAFSFIWTNLTLWIALSSNNGNNNDESTLLVLRETQKLLNQIELKTFNKQTQYLNMLEKLVQPDKLQILLWEGSSWANFQTSNIWKEPNYIGEEIKLKECPVKCEFTENKSLVAIADGVFFDSGFYHGESIEKIYQKTIPFLPQKRLGQQWIELSYETPFYFPLRNLWREFMDIHIDYNQDSEIPITFTCSWGGGKIEDFLKEPLPRTEKNPVAFIASNCDRGGATERTQYVKELMQYISIDSYGACLHNRDLPKEFHHNIYENHGRAMREKISLFQRYKFVLTFENHQEKDYVTEKYICALQAGAIPIYWGAPNIDDWLPGNRSIIKVTDFKNPKDLADHLNYLLTHEKEYRKYFKWKEAGLSKNFIQKYNRCVFYGAKCRLCEYMMTQKQSLPSIKIKPSYALVLEGAGFLTIPHSSKFDIGANLGIALWIQTHSFHSSIIIGKNNLDGDGFSLGVSPPQNNKQEEDVSYFHHGRLRFCVNKICRLSQRKLYPGLWYHVAVSANWIINQMVFYINGKMDISFKLDGSERPPSILEDEPLRIGGGQAMSSFWKGLLDNLLIFNQGLDAEKVSKIMFEEINHEKELILGDWKFDEGTGTICYDDSKNEFHANVEGFVDFLLSQTKPLYGKSFDLIEK